MDPSFSWVIQRLRRPIRPLLALQTGRAHPEFPRTMLHYHLLSERQMDSISLYYSQAVRDDYSDMYPRPINWDDEAFDHMDYERRVSVKRRLVGLFIGVLV
ncbi:hypothetical protein B0J12DRAFT_585734 [Macrophomina phaseolina]|uniref:Uncharacterized protein n=1 Tax=Macrophomina phaseolina TaxID=35725 RepID=A0ABQ8FSL8_9PEZI|nr:hypothetical protein B0J12DRAFT_585734 [Macrophomina phaseolina]